MHPDISVAKYELVAYVIGIMTGVVFSLYYHLHIKKGRKPS